jgi:hypothetical protein
MNSFANPRTRTLHWHSPALAFFAAGFIVGAIVFVASVVPGIRGMGAVAMAGAAIGIMIVGYTLRIEDPQCWAAITGRVQAFFATMASSLRGVWNRRRTFDRYLQGVVWTGMR